MSVNSLVRALFLTLLFPRLITLGRSTYATSPPPPPPTPSLPTSPTAFEPFPLPQNAEEPTPPPPPTTSSHGSHFDLDFLRISIALDSLLTLLITFSTTSWHMYLAACILPLASGTAPAAKGVVMEMVEEGEEQDALSAIALVEMVASVLTVSVFGSVFALLSEVGKAQWVFGLNAVSCARVVALERADEGQATAAVAAVVLIFVRYPMGGRKEEEW